jgi:alkylated DNA repair dioxygenase AlkB
VRDLFTLDRQFEPISMPDADVSILRDLDTHAPYQSIFESLYRDTKWVQRRMWMYGRWVDQPRMTAWHGDPSRVYKYSGIKEIPMPWSDHLRELKRRIEDCTETEFNSVLLNLYRDQNDSMGFHSDDEKELGPEPVIASFSLGETRTFIFKHKSQKDLKPVSIPLLEGSVLLMKGKTQRNWKHAINRESRICGPRINLTFRHVYTSAELEELKRQEFEEIRGERQNLLG